MRTFIGKEITANFSQNDGWAVAQAKALSGYNQALSIERFYNGMQESVKLGVCLDRAVSPEFIDAVRSTAQAAPAKFGLLVAKNADVSAVPQSWKILTMQGFGFEGENLVWYKNPARRVKPEAAKATPA
jgi:hypothetical protein